LQWFTGVKCDRNSNAEFVEFSFELVRTIIIIILNSSIKFNIAIFHFAVKLNEDQQQQFNHAGLVTKSGNIKE